jgi:hypothetical protein
MLPPGLACPAICDAIRRRERLAFDYDGRARVVEPYCHGVSRGGEALRGVQVAGESRSGGFGFGKLWMVQRMRNVRCTGQSFVPSDPDYNPEDGAMLSIHCRL